MADDKEISLARIYKSDNEKLKQVQAYLTIELGREITQPEALKLLIDAFLSKKEPASKNETKATTPVRIPAGGLT